MGQAASSSSGQSTTAINSLPLSSSASHDSSPSVLPSPALLYVSLKLSLKDNSQNLATSHSQSVTSATQNAHVSPPVPFSPLAGSGGLTPYIFGEHPYLGSWESEKAIPMEVESNNSWEISTVLPAYHGRIAFRFLLMSKDGEIFQTFSQVTSPSSHPIITVEEMRNNPRFIEYGKLSLSDQEDAHFSIPESSCVPYSQNFPAFSLSPPPSPSVTVTQSKFSFSSPLRPPSQFSSFHSFEPPAVSPVLTFSLAVSCSATPLSPFSLGMSWKSHQDALTCRGALVQGLPDVSLNDDIEETLEPAIKTGVRGTSERDGGKLGDSDEVQEGGEIYCTRVSSVELLEEGEKEREEGRETEGERGGSCGKLETEIKGKEGLELNVVAFSPPSDSGNFYAANTTETPRFLRSRGALTFAPSPASASPSPNQPSSHRPAALAVLSPLIVENSNSASTTNLGSLLPELTAGPGCPAFAEPALGSVRSLSMPPNATVSGPGIFRSVSISSREIQSFSSLPHSLSLPASPPSAVKHLKTSPMKPIVSIKDLVLLGEEEATITGQHEGAENETPPQNYATSKNTSLLRISSKSSPENASSLLSSSATYALEATKNFPEHISIIPSDLNVDMYGQPSILEKSTIPIGPGQSEAPVALEFSSSNPYTREEGSLANPVRKGNRLSLSVEASSPKDGLKVTDANRSSSFPSFTINPLPSLLSSLSHSSLSGLPDSAGAVAAAAVSERIMNVGTKERRRVAIVMVGLPARGKTFTASKLTRYLRWLGHDTKHFNVGKYRRMKLGTSQNSEFFRFDNEEGVKARNEVAYEAFDDMLSWMEEGGQVGVFDATNSTSERRSKLMEMAQGKCKVIFLETLCYDDEVIHRNALEKIQTSPDYSHISDPEVALQDFKKRLNNYEKAYEPVTEGSYIKLINMVCGTGGQLQVNNISGYLPGRIVFFLLNIHIEPRPIFLTRHGQSLMNVRSRIGGDSKLSSNGEEYASKLSEFIHARLENEQAASIWTSTLQRTILTARHIHGYPKVQWRALDEINAGVCDGMTYEEIKATMPEEYKARKHDKLRYRYPRGESYLDVIQRLEPVIIELERQRAPVVVVAHQAVLRALYAYFTDRPLKEIPHVEMPLHCVIELTSGLGGLNEKRYNLI